MHCRRTRRPISVIVFVKLQQPSVASCELRVASQNQIKSSHASIRSNTPISPPLPLRYVFNLICPRSQRASNLCVCFELEINHWAFSWFGIVQSLIHLESLIETQIRSRMCVVSLGYGFLHLLLASFFPLLWHLCAVSLLVWEYIKKKEHVFSFPLIEMWLFWLLPLLSLLTSMVVYMEVLAVILIGLASFFFTGSNVKWFPLHIHQKLRFLPSLNSLHIERVEDCIIWTYLFIVNAHCVKDTIFQVPVGWIKACMLC